MPSKLDPCHDNPVSLGPLWLLGTNCLKTAAAEVIWRLVVPVSFSNSSLQNGRRFHTVGFKFPADSSSLQMPRGYIRWKLLQPCS